jgi:hypothetical protein
VHTSSVVKGMWFSVKMAVGKVQKKRTKNNEPYEDIFDWLVQLARDSESTSRASRTSTPEVEAEFDSSFAIRPGGLHGLVPHILPACLALPVAVQAGTSADAASVVYENLTEMVAQVTYVNQLATSNL